MNLPYSTRVEGTKRLVDKGRFVLSADISAGLDMALYVVARLHTTAWSSS